MTEQRTSLTYLPIVAAVIVLSIVLFLIDLRLWAQPAAMQPTPTPVIIIVATPEAVTVGDQLTNLRGQIANQVGGSLPSLDQFRAGMGGEPAAQPTPVRSVEDLLLPNPQGAPVAYRVHSEDGRAIAIEGAGVLYYCTDVLGGTVPHWTEWPDYMRSQMASICGGGA